MVTVSYVNGLSYTAAPALWRDLPGEGVDRVEIQDATGKVVVQSASLYWLYPEGGGFVMGWGSVRYDPNPLTEIVFADDTQRERRISYMPDLMLHQVKLGHWRLGESRPE